MSFNSGFFIQSGGSISTDLYMMRFDGVNESITVPTYTEIDFTHTQAISGSAIIKLSDYSSGSIQYIISKSDAFAKGYYFSVYPSGVLVVTLISSVGSIISIYTPTPPFVDGTQYHVAFTYNGNTDVSGLKLYINGVSVSTSIDINTGLNATLVNGEPLCIGTSLNTPTYIAGDIGIVRMWNTELTASDILEDYNGGVMKNIPIKPLNLVFGWKAGQDALFGTQWVFPEEGNHIDNPSIYSANMELVDRILIP